MQRLAEIPASPVDIRALLTYKNQSAHTRPLKVALVGTFAPRKCGIATFTSDISQQLAEFHPQIDLQVYALDYPGSGLEYDPSVKRIDPNSSADYGRTAREINECGYDAVWLQHEFGIYGGTDGELVIDFVDRLAPPLVVTFHTVLRDASERQLAIMRHLVARSSRIMVMSQHSRDLLVGTYDARQDRIAVIPHGAPDRPFGREEQFKARLGLADRRVLMTFGLLGPGKGLEHMIAALPAIVARHPDVLYRIVGATHPNLVAEQGEAYRDGLESLARSLGVEDNVAWDNRFLETGELLDQLEACDIYVTPYPNLQQSTSGTLSYAVALGKAVVATPYLHARELLADGVGVLVDPSSSEALAKAICGLLDDPERLESTRRRAYAAGRQTVWPQFALASARLLDSAVEANLPPVPFGRTPEMAAVLAMSDQTGMLQHSIGIVPDRRHGYCLDDNARALILMNLTDRLSSAERMRLTNVYASFIQHAWNPDLRRFRNFMNYDRTWCETVGSEDSNGRALWALGHTVLHAPDADMRRWALEWFDRTAAIFFEIDSPRAVAFAMLGAACVARSEPDHAEALRLLEHGGSLLYSLLEASRRPDWAWFEAVLSYDNPRLSQALIEAGGLLARERWVDAGLDTLTWIASRQISAEGYFRPVGSDGFGLINDQLPFDQQPLEAQAAIEAAASAWRASGHKGWIEHARTVYGWYFGRNDRRVVLADVATGRCFDGVTPRGANTNSGAESILAFQLAFRQLMMVGATEGNAMSNGANAEFQIAGFSAAPA